jgi:hypothetical protein
MTEQQITTCTRDENALGEKLPSLYNLEGITLIWYDPNMSLTVGEQLKVTKTFKTNY